MPTEVSSHFRELLHSAADMETFHAGTFLVPTTPSLVPRTDHSRTIFQEGEDFSGFECEGYARSCLTPQVVPFSLPSVATHLFVEGAERILGEEVRISEHMENIEKVTPHVLVWWQRQDDVYKPKGEELDPQT